MKPLLACLNFLNLFWRHGDATSAVPPRLLVYARSC